MIVSPSFKQLDSQMPPNFGGAQQMFTAEVGISVHKTAVRCTLHTFHLTEVWQETSNLEKVPGKPTILVANMWTEVLL